jgi:gluconolactonase
VSRPSTVAPPFRTHDDAFAAVLGDAPRLERVVSVDAHEGPVYAPAEDALYFTTLPQPGPEAPVVAIKRVALHGARFPVEPERVRVVRPDANVANGMTLALTGDALLVCEQGTRTTAARISRFDPRTGAVETVVDAYDGLPLGSPNDVVGKTNHTVWFTDPSYGHLQGFRPAPRTGDHVYRHDPRTGATTVVAGASDTPGGPGDRVALDKPNGLAFSPDESVLYVTDSGANHEPGTYDPRRPHHTVAFDVRDGDRLENARVFTVTTPGFPDGITVDAAGRVYVSAASGVQVFSPTGVLLGEIALPGGAVNFTFGGPDRDVLFITADDAIWAAVLNTTGA